MTKKSLCLLFSIAISTSMLSQANKYFQIKGFTNPYYEGKMAILSLYNEKSNVVSKDSMRIANGKFSFESKEYKNGVSYVGIADQDYNKVITLILEEGIIKIDIDTVDHHLGGTPINNKLQIYRDSSKTYFEKYFKFDRILQKSSEDSLIQLNNYIDYNSFVGNIIIDNIDNPLGEYIFSKNGMACPDSIFEKIVTKIGDRKTNKSIAEVIKARENYRLRKLLVGTQFKDFSAFDTNGTPITLGDLIGKSDFLYLDFWASWCGPCIAGIPDLKKIYNKYKIKGLEIMGISLDKEKKSWINAIKKFQIDNWLHCSGLDDTWISEMEDKYKFDGIPYGILIDKYGVILSVNIDSEDLDELLSKITDHGNVE